MSTGTRVILLHGLRVNRVVMAYLARYLHRRGLDVDCWSYPSHSSELERCAELLGQRLDQEPASRIHLVAHSYGGVVTLAQLARRHDARVRRAVLLGAPIAGSVAGIQVARHAPGRWFVGQTRRVWEQGPGVAIPASVEVGAIAGVGKIGLGRFFTDIDRASDGVVAVEETKLPGLTDHIVMATSHSLMLVSAAVARQVDHFLRHGSFAR